MLLRGTRVENPVEEVAQVFAKIPGGSRISWKIAKGGPPISGFIAFLLKSVLKFVWGVLNLQSTFPPPPSSVCVYVDLMANISLVSIWHYRFLNTNISIKRKYDNYLLYL